MLGISTKVEFCTETKESEFSWTRRHPLSRGGGKKIINSDKKETKIKTIIHNNNKYELSSIQEIGYFLITENNDSLILVDEYLDGGVSYNLYLYPIKVDSLNDFKLILADKSEIDLTKTKGNAETKPTMYSISEIIANHK